MKEFAITCLIIILFATTHLINWMWRYTTTIDNPIPTGKIYIAGSIFLTFVYAFVCGICLFYVVKWGKDYFKK